MDRVEYSIGEDYPRCSTRKTKSLYLYRQKGSVISTIARFRTIEMAKRFAKDFGFPLSDSVQEIINKDKANE